MNDPPRFSSFDVCIILEISYRQLDYWMRCGIADATDGAQGSGSRRRFSRADISDIALIDAVRQWVWSPHRAAELISEIGPDARGAGGLITIKTDGALSLVVDIDALEANLDQRIAALFPEKRATA